MGMSGRILYESSLVSNRTVNLRRRNDVLFGASVAQDRTSFMKEIEDPVVHISVTHTQLVNPVTQEIGFGPTQFVTELRQALDPNDAFVPNLVLKLVHPDQQRH